MKSIGEILFLPFIYIKLFWFNLQEERKVTKYFYKNICFKEADTSLKQLYSGENPYKICKDFMQKSKKSQVHVYGETPLTELYAILLKCHLTEKDCFIDIGCGRGRNIFFTSAFFGCKTLGLDIVPLFCERADRIAFFLENPPQFICEDMETFDLNKATIIYFYAICLEDDLLLKMIDKLSKLKKGTKVITVSFPLSDYSKVFSTLFSKKAFYPWGKTELFLNLLT